MERHRKGATEDEERTAPDWRQEFKVGEKFQGHRENFFDNDGTI